MLPVMPLAICRLLSSRSWFDIGQVQAVEQVPQNFRLLDQGPHTSFLQLMREGVLNDEFNGLLRIKGGVGYTHLKIPQGV